MGRTRALLLAAGYATRLYPLTKDRPKPLLDVGGRPLLSHLLDRIVELEDLVDVTVVTNHRFALHFERWAEEAACPVPLRILDDGSQSEEDRLGAIGDLAFALERIDVEDDDTWLVAAGDNLIEVDLADVFREYERRPTTRIIVRPLPETRGPSPYNDVKVAPDGRVIRFREKPADPQGDRAAIAVYLFPGSLRDWVPLYLDAGGNPDAPGYFLQWLCTCEPVYASQLRGRWFDVGTPETLEAARRHFERAE